MHMPSQAAPMVPPRMGGSTTLSAPPSQISWNLCCLAHMEFSSPTASAQALAIGASAPRRIRRIQSVTLRSITALFTHLQPPQSLLGGCASQTDGLCCLWKGAKGTAVPTGAGSLWYANQCAGNQQVCGSYCRNGLPARAAHRMLQVLLATALTGHLPGGADVNDAIVTRECIHTTCHLEHGVPPANSDQHDSVHMRPSTAQGTELLHTFLGIRQPYVTAAPKQYSASWLGYEVWLLARPLEEVLSTCSSWAHLCARVGASVPIWNS